MSSESTTPSNILFDPTPEIFATDTGGAFLFPLVRGEEIEFDTLAYDEIRFVFSIWYPSGKHLIDFDRAYCELRGSFDPEEEHWVKLAEIEPLVPPYGAGDSFDCWLMLPVLSARGRFQVAGSGFEPRTRLQIRSSAYLVT
jgi:hypothetical protein